MLKYTLTGLLVLAHAIQTFAFCGFYVAKADAKLFNKASQVIIARDGTQTAVTMSSDFEGNVKDFAMVIPVAEVLKRSQIRIANPAIFDKLDAYSGPRLVEYHDSNPCQVQYLEMEDVALSAAPTGSARPRRNKSESKKDLGVTVLESYTIGEYDILILSAKESGGLETWLKANGYKIPEKAASVLEPYIKSDMKFFVVKVNLNNFQNNGFEKLRPIQMTFRSDKFMLPIRLGMANANGDQDLVIYSFAKKGRIETTNYRTVEIPTDKNIPLFVNDKFGEFYKSLFDKAWADAGKNAVMMEYAWDLSSKNFVKCDPCPTQPPVYTDLREAGVFWVNQGGNQRWGGSDYDGDLFMTRLHVRYNRSTFPQDLQFQQTPNNKSFQGRYIMNHPAQGDLSCEQGQTYLKTLINRRKDEVGTLGSLTGWKTDQHTDYIYAYNHLIKGSNNPFLGPLPEKEDRNLIPIFPTNRLNGPGYGLLLAFILLSIMGFGIIWKIRRKTIIA